jgi:hypothetical protein
VRGLGKQEWPNPADTGGIGGGAQIRIHFHAVTIAGQTPGQPIDKKCGCLAKINAAKSAGKERFKVD